MRMAVAVMGGAQQPEIVRLGATSERIRHNVIYLQQMPGAAPAPTAPVHVAAGRFATVTRRWPASAGTFGAEVAEPAGGPVC